MQGCSGCGILDNWLLLSSQQYIFAKDSAHWGRSGEPQGVCFDAEDNRLTAEGGLHLGVVSKVLWDGDVLGHIEGYAAFRLLPFPA